MVCSTSDINLAITQDNSTIRPESHKAVRSVPTMRLDWFATTLADDRTNWHIKGRPFRWSMYSSRVIARWL
jgi:hypothetical protein